MMREIGVGWRYEFGGDRPPQVYPVGDLRSHVIDGRPCWCEPALGDDAETIVHNSLDEREKFETGQRRPS